FLPLQRCAEDGRPRPLRVECVAKTVRLRFDYAVRPAAAIDRQLIAGRPRGLRKLVELFLQVKDLFLQIYYVPGTELRELYSVRRHIELPTQNGLPNSEPPWFDHRPRILRHFS